MPAELGAMLRAFGNAAIGVALGLSVLGAGFVASNFAAGQGTTILSGGAVGVTRATGTAAQRTPAATVSATPVPATPASTAVASTAPSASPPPTSTPTAAATERVLAVAPYVNGGRRYAALRAPVGYVFTAPVGGRVTVRLYQLIDGDVRVGSSFPALPFYPYITVESSDRRVIFRPGALNDDTQMLVKDGEVVAAGGELFKTVGAGASSWRAFYDRGVTANVIASVAALPGGTEVDPVAFFESR